MSSDPFSTLPVAYAVLIFWMRLVARLLPETDRVRWSAEWDGELWYCVAAKARAGQIRTTIVLSMGMLRDAFEVRRIEHSNRRSLRRGPNKKRMQRTLSRIASYALDLRYAFRSLLKAPGFSAVAVVTLAIGIGANTAFFSVLNGVVLRPLPYVDADRVVRVWPEHTFSKGLLSDLGQQARSYSGLSGFSSVVLTLTGIGDPEELSGAAVSVNHFDLLGVTPFLGRTFDSMEQEPGQDRVVILSHGIWKRRFGSDPDIIGKTIQLGTPEEQSRTVIGVLPSDHRPLRERWSAWIPLSVDPTNFGDYRGTWSLDVVGRLRTGVAIEQAHAEIRDFAARLKKKEGYERLRDEVVNGASVVPFLDSLVGEIRQRIELLFLAVGFVLLIGCTNVANLLLVRGASRSREIGIRLAIGAGRWRVIRQIFAEAVSLALVGGGAGLCAAIWLISVLKKQLPPGVPRADLITVDLRVLAFTFGLSLLASLVFGLGPALRTAGRNAQSSLLDGGRGVSVGAGHLRLNGALVVLETALAVVLVVGAGLMIKNFWLLNQVDPGFNTKNLITMRVSPPSSRYENSESLREYYARVFERLEGAPDVASVSMINLLPMTGGNIGVLYDVEGFPLPDGIHRPAANLRSVALGHFQAMGMPVLRGRVFNITDADGDPVVVNETMARDMSTDGNVVGQKIGGFSGDDVFTVIGVVADVRQHGLQLEPRPEIYFSYLSWTPSAMYLLIRTTDNAAQRIETLKQVIWTVDNDVPISYARTMEAVIGISVADSRFLTQLLTGFALLALVLGVIGVYGVLSYAVSQRTREIGVRMALGAPRSVVSRSALRQGLTLVSCGVVVGILGAAAASRMLSRFLFGVNAIDPVVYAAVVVLLLLVATVASFVPARRASRIDPLMALRFE